MRRLCVSILGLLVVASAMGPTVRMPDGEKATLVQSGTGPEARLKDGTRLLGVNLGWYTAAAASKEPLSEQDLAEIKELLTVPSFYDRVVPLRLVGDSERVTALVELIRDRDFHAGKGEAIWRAELWYFEFQNGGWAKVSQQNRVLDRQRFRTADAYRAYVSKLRFAAIPSRPAATQPNQIELSPADIIAPSPVR